MRILHAKPENTCAKMSEFGSFCVHHVALNGEAVKSNDGSLLGARGYGLLCQIVLPQGEAVTAVCDIYEDRIRCAADAVEAAAGKKPAEYTDFPVRLCFTAFPTVPSLFREKECFPAFPVQVSQTEVSDRSNASSC